MVVGAAISLLVVAAACGTKADVTRDELASVVERDGITFTGLAIPDELVVRLATNQVVVLGETHHLREHWGFTAELLRELHAHGFRQLLIEQPQMVDWVLDDHLTGGQLDPEWEIPPHLDRKLGLIRELNSTLPASEQIHVRSIDVNETWYGGADAMRWLIERVTTHLPSSGPLEAFLAATYDTQGAQSAAIEALLDALEADRTSLVASWGSDWYDRIVETAEVERSSIKIRAEDDGNRAARAREEVIKQLADARIGDFPHGTVINIGGHHAQKSHLMGTDQEWLGDYLVHRSTAVEGTVIVIAIASAKTELEPGADGTPFDVLDASPEHELYRVMVETWPGQNVFLPLDDPLFSTRTIAMNSEEVTYVTEFKEQFDAVLQYGLAHRMAAD